ncbi:hypothetical protein K4W91_21385 [Pseudomonas aeruginosa]|uniref:hypothetical protein n=1 Tax=Pseudomonas aeruginosa TaxID=287 RepID=UPI000FD39324|nr:hypothetical protein [Pseudomonas aeruginosa]MCD2824296.1 hypothetical protein [Pseudomonas aeruginosa]MCD2830654.1 hypothetical protein [Pseudomonas aeruginosa]RUI01261.1 hypothetical protein IPC449_25055 [Pseudomonas aeruginosa]HCF4146258.1 hypothetical protein [Pseudomonas aeruginosa]HCK3347109.1 hypothetical protein [Pseudomonas aeruginosa]
MKDVIYHSAVLVRREIENERSVHDLTRNDPIATTFISTIDAAIAHIANVFDPNSNVSVAGIQDCANKIQESESIISLLSSYLVTPQNILAVTRNQLSPHVVTNVSTWLNNILSPWIKNLGGAIWTFLSQKLSVKEWKISGGISAVGLVNASLELTFDPLQGNSGGGTGHP